MALNLDHGHQAPVRRSPDCWSDPGEALLLLRVAEHQDGYNCVRLLVVYVRLSLRGRSTLAGLERTCRVLELGACLEHGVVPLVTFFMKYIHAFFLA